MAFDDWDLVNDLTGCIEALERLDLPLVRHRIDELKRRLGRAVQQAQLEKLERPRRPRIIDHFQTGRLGRARAAERLEMRRKQA